MGILKLFAVSSLAAIATNLALTHYAAASVLTEAQWEENCASITQQARYIMIRRQNGAELEDLLPSKDSQSYDLTLTITQQAYAEPRYGADARRIKAQDDFTNKWKALCNASKRADLSGKTAP